MFSRYLIFLIFITCTPASEAQIVINEVCSANDSVIKDDEGDYEDWIELYNTDTNDINLYDYSLTKYIDSPEKWYFPGIIIKAKSHLTVFASGKNRQSPIDHWEVPIYPQLIWKYFVGTSEPDPQWLLPSFNDAVWADGMGGIGYGDGDDSTIISPTTSLYMRKSIFIADTSRISLGIFLVDYDDGFVAYLNGVEIARSNVGAFGDHPFYDQPAYEEHEAQVYQGGNLDGFFIPEKTIDLALIPGINVFTIQIHNISSASSDMSSIPYMILGISDTSVVFYPLPNESFALHTNFTLPSEGCKLTLKDKDENILDEKIIEEIYLNDSRGRNPDGAASWCLFDIPSPNKSNDFSLCFSAYAEIPVITPPSGFYNNPVDISAVCITSNQDIHYSLNGSIPDFPSQHFTVSILTDSTLVFRARNMGDQTHLPGKTATNTYLLGENITLPVISISTNPENLWDWYTGIYVMGPNADSTFPYYNANFWQDWEKLCHVEYFATNGNQGFELDAGLKIHGNASKGFPQKSFRILANDDYGTSWINYSLFTEKNIDRFKNFNIRNAGIDWIRCYMRDGLIHETVSRTHNDVMAHENCVVFLNGMYWGVYETREKEDKYYIQENHGVDGDKIDLLRFDGDIMQGSNEGFFNMVDYISSNDMGIQQNYDSACALLDIENFCDYFITETYFVNTDWLGYYTNNIRYWRTNDPVSKWRYILWDTDGGLGLFSSADYDLLATAIDPPTPNPHSVMLKSLLNNQEFRYYFINRYADMINTYFHPQNVRNKAFGILEDLEPEMERNYDLWGSSFPGWYNDINTWHSNIDTMLMFSDSRPFFARLYIMKDFDLAKMVEVTLNTIPENAGRIQISTIIPDSLPWSGIYFDGVPVTITAIPNPGYSFKNWTSDHLIADSITDLSFTLNIDTNDAFTAHFETVDFSFYCYPNPVSDILYISYSIPAETQVSLNIYSVAGKKIEELESYSSFQTAGTHIIEYNIKPKNISNGVYFIQLITPDYSEIIKFVFL